jgi:hypothetical protein
MARCNVLCDPVIPEKRVLLDERWVVGNRVVDVHFDEEERVSAVEIVETETLWARVCKWLDW